MPTPRPTVPARTIAKLRAICLELAGAYEEAAWTGTRWMVRKRNFAHVVSIDAGWPPAYARAAGTDGPAIVLTFRASGDLADVLRTAGPPFFHAPWGTQWGTQVIGIVLGRRVDWNEVTTLVGESHRLLAGPRTARARRPIGRSVARGQSRSGRASAAAQPASLRRRTR